MTDTEIINGLLLKDETAFRELVKAYGDRVHNTVLSIVQQKEDAEDLAQDVFIKVFSSINTFEGNSLLFTWIYRIATNISLDYLRKKKRQKRFGFITGLFGNNNKEADQVSDFVHPGIMLDQKDDAAVLFAAIKKLPEKQQAAFILNKTEGLSYNEIAAILNTTEPAVDALLQRAKQKLRQIIDKKNIF